MLQKTNGIIINSLKYGDNSLIIKVLDNKDQVQSLFVRSRKKYPSLQIPLLKVEVLYRQEESKSLYTVKEISIVQPYVSIPVNPGKGAQVFFIQEILSMVTKEPGYSPGIYSFVSELLEDIDKQENRSDFHILFLAKLSGFLGFFPGNIELVDPTGFDLQEGLFLSGVNYGAVNHIVPQETTKAIQSYFQGRSPAVSKINRNRILDELIKYYMIHFEGFREPKSIEVLRLLFQ